MAEQKRELERYLVDDTIDVYDNVRDLYLGRLVNIHSRGLMVMGDQPLEEDKLYKLDLHLQVSVNGHSSIHLGVDCLWTRNANHNGKHWAGFSIVDVSPAAADAIAALIHHLELGSVEPSGHC